MSAGRNVITKSTDWCTPFKYVKAIKDFFDGDIDLDPCSNEFSIVNAKTEYKLPENGLDKIWKGKIFVNPPYGRDKIKKTSISHWIQKCYNSYLIDQSEILALIPVATNTKHWKNYIFNCATAICFLNDTRLKFMIEGKECKKGAPMACAMIYWGNNKYYFFDIFKDYGNVVFLEKDKK